LRSLRWGSYDPDGAERCSGRCDKTATRKKALHAS
jgi:hypothetical protein